MILVEGPDGAGKTVLVGQLTKLFTQLRMVPDHRETKGEKEKTKEERRIGTVRSRTYLALAEAFKGTKPLIHDRLFYSELVYGPILRDRVKFHPVERQFIQDCFSVLGCPIIICLPPFKVVEHNVHNTEDHLEGVNEKIEELYGSYVALAADLEGDEHLNFIGYDYTRKGQEHELVHKVQVYLEARTVREA